MTADGSHCPACAAAGSQQPAAEGAPHVPGVPPPGQMPRREFLARLAAMDAEMGSYEPGTPEYSEAWHDRSGFAANWSGALANEPFHGLRERAREAARRLFGPEPDPETEPEAGA